MSIWSYLAKGEATGIGYDDLGSGLRGDSSQLETWTWDVSTAASYGTDGLIRFIVDMAKPEGVPVKAWEAAACQFTPVTARKLRDALNSAIEFLEEDGKKWKNVPDNA